MTNCHDDLIIAIAMLPREDDLKQYQMNKTVNKFLLAGDKFMYELHLRQPKFTYNTCGLFTKNKERIQNVKETGDSRHILSKRTR